MLRIRPLSAAVAAAMGVVPAAHAAGNLIVPNGRTHTRIRVNGNVTDITTSTIRGSTAFNAFSQFREASGSIVNLRIPQQAVTLLNMVYGGQTVIDGVLNAYRDGRIGGHVVFADPQGMVVGASGVLNVGALTVTAPTRAFMDRVLSESGRVDLDATRQLLAGRAPQSADGMIRIVGQINALDGIDLQAASVLETASGRMNAGVAAYTRMKLFESTVNTQGLQQATRAVVHNGVISIEGSQSARIAGTLRASGPGQGGMIGVSARQVTLTDSAHLDVSGTRGGGTISIGGGPHARVQQGTAQTVSVAKGAILTADATQRGDGGHVTVWSQAGTDFGGTISARGGAAGGNGGQVEVSARTGLDFHGSVDTRAPQGMTGDLLLDPTNLDIVATLPSGGTAASSTTPGTYGGFGQTPATSYITVATLQGLGDTNITLQAANQITVGDSATGASTNLDLSNTLKTGTLTLEAGGTGGIGNIVFETGSSIETGGGSVVLDAGTGFAGAPDLGGAATLGSLTTQGGAITVNAGGEVDFATGSLTNTSGGALTVNAGGKVVFAGPSAGGAGIETAGGDIAVTSYAGIDLQSGALLDSTNGSGTAGAITLTATQEATNNNQNPLSWLNPLYVDSAAPSAQAEIDIAGTIAGGDVSVAATAKSQVDASVQPSVISPILGNALSAYQYTSSATAKVQVYGTASITGNSVSLSSDAAPQIALANGLALPLAPTVTAVAGELNATSTAEIDAGAQVTVSGGPLQVQATSEPTLALSVSAGLPSVSVVPGGDIALAYGSANVTTTAVVDNGAAIRMNGGNLDLGALNTQNFSVAATAMVVSGGASNVGGAAAIGVYQTSATAAEGADLTDVGNLTVNADSVMGENLTQAVTTPTAHSVPTAQNSNTTQFNALLGEVAANLSAVSWSGSNPLGGGVSLGSAVALNFNDQQAQAYIGLSPTATAGTAPTIDAAGNVAVHASTVDTGLHNIAESKATSALPSKLFKYKPASTSVSLALALSWQGGWQNNWLTGGSQSGGPANWSGARAWIGKGASVTAQRVGVGAQDDISNVSMPSSLAQLGAASIKSVYDALTGPAGLTSFAGAVSSASSLGAAGAFNYLSLGLQTQAWIAPDASVHVTNTSGQTWTSNPSPANSNATALQWNAPLDVEAHNAAATLNSAGDTALMLGISSLSSSKGSGVGGTFAWVDDSNRTQAWVAAGAALDAGGNMDVRASTADSPITYVPGGGRAKGFLAQGMTAFNRMADTTTAEISNQATLTAAGVVDLSAEAQHNAYALTGVLVVGKSGGFGVGFSRNQLDSQTQAAIGDTSGLTQSVNETAGSNACVPTATTACLAAGSLTVHAKTTDDVGAFGLGAAVSTNNAALGAGVALNQFADATRAYIDGATVGTASAPVQNVSVNADTQRTLGTLATGVAAGSTYGAAGAVVTDLLDGTTQAYIDGGTQVLAAGNVAVTAADSNALEAATGDLAFAGLGGLGLSVAVNDLNDTTQAYIGQGNGKTDVTALGLGNGVDVADGQLSSQPSVGGGISSTSYVPPTLTEGTTTVHGVAVNAQALNVGAGLAAGLSASWDPSSAALQANSATNVLGGDTEAYVDGAGINTLNAGSQAPAAGQAVSVLAGRHDYATGLATGVAGSAGVAGVGAVVANSFNATTRAYLQGGTVDAAGAVAVDAYATQDSTALAAGLAAGMFGGAGSSAVNLYRSLTQAYAQGGTLNAQSLDVEAHNDTGVNLVGGSLSIGGGGSVGASVLVNVGQDDTQAWLGDALVQGNTTATLAGGDLTVKAVANTALSLLGVTGSLSGTGAVAGAVDAMLLNDTTGANVYNATVTGAGNATVQASDTTDVSGAYAGGLGAGRSFGAGVAVNLLIARDTVAAGIDGSTVDATGAVSVAADSSKYANLFTVAGGVGGMTGIGGAVSLILSGSSSSSRVTDVQNSLDQQNASGASISGTVNAASGTHTAANDANLSASRQQTIGSLSSFNPAGGVIVTGPATSGGTIADATSATLQASSVSAGSLAVAATDSTATQNVAGGVGAAGADGMGAGIAVTSSNDDVSALLAGATVAAPTLSVTAQAQDGHRQVNGVTLDHAADVQAYDGAAGLGASLGAAVASGTIDNAVQAGVIPATVNGATVASSLSGGGSPGGVAIAAGDGESVNVAAAGVSVGGGLGAGAAVGAATHASQVSAGFSGTADGYQGMTLSASGSGAASSSATGVSAGLVAAGNAAVATVGDTSSETAGLGNGAAVTGLGSDGLSIGASDTPQASANAFGASLSLDTSAGAAVASVSVAPTVSATVGDGAVVSDASTASSSPGGLQVDAELKQNNGAPEAQANATAGSGGLLSGLDAAVATASNTAQVDASLGNGVTLPLGSVRVQALGNSDQQASATGVAVGGILAAGAAVASAQAQVATSASVGTGLISPTLALTGGTVLMPLGGDFTLEAIGSDTDQANATAGSGGLVAGDAASSSTDTRSTTRVTVADTPIVRAGLITLAARHTSQFGAQANSSNAAALGGSGAAAHNNATAATTLDIAPGAQLVGSGLQITAANVDAFLGGNTAQAGAGGLLNGSAALADSTLGGTASVDIGLNPASGQSTLLQVSGNPALSPGAMNIQAYNTLSGGNAATLTAGGLIEGAYAQSSVSANYTDAIAFGSDVNATSAGDLNVGTYSIDSPSADTEVHLYGLAGIGGGSSSATVNATQRVNVGQGDYFLAEGNLSLFAGQGPQGLNSSSVSPSASTTVYDQGLIPLATDYSGSSSATDNVSLSVAQGASLDAVRNAYLGAYRGGLGADGYGAGHFTTYALLGIPISFSKHDSHSSNNGSGGVTLDGTVTAGAWHDQTLSIDSNGNVTIAPDSHIGYTTGQLDVASLLQQRIDALTAQLQNYSALSQEYSDLAGQIAVLTIEMNSLTSTGASHVTEIGDIYAAAGNVYLHADSLGGSGSLSAYGGPHIDISNKQAGNSLFLDRLTIPIGTGGKVYFTGSDASAPTGMQVNALDAGKAATINIDNSPLSTSIGDSNIFLTGGVTNLSGSVRVDNQYGSIFQSGSIRAAQIVLTAPNGSYVVNDPNSGWFGSDPTAYWVSNYLDAITAGQMADVLTNYLYNKVPPLGTSAYASWQCAGATCQSYESNQFGQYLLNGLHIAPIGFPSIYTGLISNYSVDVVPTDHAYGYPAGTALGGSTVVFGGQVGINAKYIDINAPIRSGLSDWGVTLGAGAYTQIQADRAAYAAGGKRLYQLTQLTAPGTNQQPISAVYDAAHDRIDLQKVNAAGGYVYLHGDIISTNPLGKITVGAGYGHVTIDNTTGVPVVLDTISTGSGSPGEVKIVDTAKAGYQNSPLTTWYIYTPGGGVKVYDNANNGALTQIGSPQLIAQTAGNAATYDPQAGQRYQWTQTAYLERPNASLSNNWSWADQNYHALPAGSPVFSPAADFGIVQGSTDTSAYRWQVSGGTFSPGPPGGSTGVYWVYPTHATVTVTSSVYASNPFGIDFVGHGQGQISVNSDAPVILGGGLYNAGGLTSISTSSSAAGAGSAITQTRQGEIDTRDLNLSATGNIGSTDQPLAVELSGGLSAQTTSGGIDILTLSSLPLFKVAAPGAVNLQAQGSILAAPGATAAPLVSGGDINLVSTAGGIGTAAAPLTLDAQPQSNAYGATVGGVVDASALGDIDLVQTQGDMRIGSIASAVGNVSLAAPQGKLVNAVSGSHHQVGSARLNQIWSNLGITSSTAVQQNTVVPYEHRVDSAYQTYWGVRDHSSLQNGQVTLSATQLAFFTPAALAQYNATHAQQVASLSPDQVTAYVQSRYDGAAQTLSGALGTGWASQAPLQTYDANYRFTLSTTSQAYAQLTQGGVWSQGQLLNVINQDALVPAAGSGQFLDQAANVSGRGLDLTAQGIGTLGTPVSIDIPQSGGTLTLTAQQQNALASAQAPGEVTLWCGSTQCNAQVLDGSTQTLGLTRVSIQQTNPLVVASTGSVTASATQGAVYLQATGPLSLSGLNATGDVQLLANGAISAASGADPLLDIGGNLNLVSETGAIGSAATPLTLALGGQLGSVSAAGDVYLEQTAGDFTLGNLYAGGLLSLTAGQGSLLSAFPASSTALHLQGNGIALHAAGSIGRSSVPLYLDAGSGVVQGAAGGDAWLSDPVGTLAFGRFDAAGQIAADAVGDIVLGELGSGVTQGQAFTLDAGGAIRGNGTGQINLTALGPQALTTLQAAGDIGQAATPLLVELPELSATSRTGGVAIRDLESVAVPQLTAATTASLDVAHGSISMGTLSARQGLLSALQDIDLRQAWVADQLALFANGQISAKVVQRPASGKPLDLSVAGYEGQGMAGPLDLQVVAPAGLNFPVLHAMNANLTLSQSRVSIGNGYIGGAMTLNTPQVSLLMNNLDPARRSADFQLYQPNTPFVLTLSGKHLFTSAYVVHYVPGYKATVPNYWAEHASTGIDYTTGSAVRNAGVLLEHNLRFMRLPRMYRMHFQVPTASLSSAGGQGSAVNTNDEP